MLRELLRRARRAVAAQVVRARAHHAPVGRELARRERGILELGDAHREVEAFLDHVHVAVGEAERELHLRVARGEARDQRRDVLVAERGGQRDAQDALRLAAAGGDRGVGFLDLRRGCGVQVS